MHIVRSALAGLIALSLLGACTPIADQSSGASPGPSVPPGPSLPDLAKPPGQLAAAEQAARQLGQLAVATSASMSGYSRARFPHWRDTGPNCDVRDSVLRRDGERLGPVKLSGCNVVGGRWYSPYDGKTLTDPKAVDIDHTVPLANAWRSGAAAWDDKRRGDFANDLTRPQLKAVSLNSNRAKGDQDPSQWKPTVRAYWCQYAQDWIAVKYYWKLTVTAAEKATLEGLIEIC